MTMTQQTANPANIALAQTEYDNEKKSPGVAYALWFFLGVWTLIDVFLIGKRIRTINTQKREEIMESYGVTINQGGAVNVAN